MTALLHQLQRLKQLSHNPSYFAPFKYFCKFLIFPPLQPFSIWQKHTENRSFCRRNKWFVTRTRLKFIKIRDTLWRKRHAEENKTFLGKKKKTLQQFPGLKQDRPHNGFWGQNLTPGHSQPSQQIKTQLYEHRTPGMEPYPLCGCNPTAKTIPGWKK